MHRRADLSGSGCGVELTNGSMATLTPMQRFVVSNPLQSDPSYQFPYTFQDQYQYNILGPRASLQCSVQGFATDATNTVSSGASMSHEIITITRQ